MIEKILWFAAIYLFLAFVVFLSVIPEDKNYLSRNWHIVKSDYFFNMRYATLGYLVVVYILIG